MSAAQIIDLVLDAGGQIAVDGTDLMLTAPQPLPDDLLDQIVANKPDIVRVLASPFPPRPRGLDIPAAQAPGMTNPPGVSSEFATRLSPEDMEDVRSGGISLQTVRAFERAGITTEAEDLREYFMERAGILEHDGGLPKREAELESARMTGALARNRQCLWASLREAFSEHPELLAQLPVEGGAVDGLPLGLATVHVRKDGSVLRQGEFVGPQELKKA